MQWKATVHMPAGGWIKINVPFLSVYAIFYFLSIVQTGCVYMLISLRDIRDTHFHHATNLEGVDTTILLQCHHYAVMAHHICGFDRYQRAYTEMMMRESSWFVSSSVKPEIHQRCNISSGHKPILRTLFIINFECAFK